MRRDAAASVTSSEERTASPQQILDQLGDITGLPSPKFKVPHMVAMAFAYFDENFNGRFRKREPRATVEEVRMGKKFMWVDSAKARRELGYQHQPVRNALERAAFSSWKRATPSLIRRWSISQHRRPGEPTGTDRAGRSAGARSRGNCARLAVGENHRRRHGAQALLLGECGTYLRRHRRGKSQYRGQENTSQSTLNY